MVRKIAVPLDGSSFSERVLAHIPRLGAPGEVELLLIRVLELSRYYAYMAPDAVHVLDVSQWRNEAQAYLKQIAGELREQGYQVTVNVTDGDVATAICSVADAQDADLIAMTTHGRSGLQRWLMGSVAERVIRTAHQPVYLVRPGKEPTTADRPQRLLVPLDGSALAEQALPLAVDLAEQSGAELLLVQAVEIPELWGDEFITPEAVTTLPSVEEQEILAQDYLERTASSLQQAGHTARFEVRVGHPASVIASLVAENAVDMVVMSTHGRSGLSRWVFGSIAEKVMRTVECPVLLVRAGVNNTRQPAVEENAEPQSTP